MLNRNHTLLLLIFLLWFKISIVGQQLQTTTRIVKDTTGMEIKDTWDQLNNTTWHGPRSAYLYCFIFFENNQGDKLCLKQIYGSGVYAHSIALEVVNKGDAYTIEDDTLTIRDEVLYKERSSAVIDGLFEQYSLEAFLQNPEAANVRIETGYLNPYPVKMGYLFNDLILEITANEAEKYIGKKLRVMGVQSKHQVVDPARKDIRQGSDSVLYVITNPIILIVEEY